MKTTPQTNEALKQIDEVLKQHEAMRAKSGLNDLSDLGEMETTELLTNMSFAIERFAMPRSRHLVTTQDTLSSFGPANSSAAPILAGVLRSLRSAYASGHLESIAQLVHADMFADFLEMAQYLLDEGGYKDPAAVLAGGVLEGHLRNLCLLHGIATQSSGKPKKAESINAELASVSAYSKSDQKSVTAWLDLRNRAAHGRYSEYGNEQVAVVLMGVRDFVTRVPA